ncbi:MAG: hypothetical protein Kow00117_23560 [Phototrophicales bacterium]
MRIKNFHYELSWARLVSDILSPPIVWALLAFPIAFREVDSVQEALRWASIYIFLVCVVPILFIFWMVKRGSITDIHMKIRRQRIRPFLVSLFSTGLAWVVLRLMGAPSMILMLALFSLIQLTVMTFITLVWQISIHAISISGATVALAVLFGSIPALLSTPTIFIVGAARIKLKRHTPAQVLAGTLVGMIIPLALFVFML